MIAGFGLPGRAVAEALDAHGVGFTVIEMNRDVVERCRHAGFRILCGDGQDESVLIEAGIERATLVAIMIPSDDVMLAVVQVVRKLRPDVAILARANYLSAGMRAIRLGGVSVVVAEQTVASAAAERITEMIRISPA